MKKISKENVLYSLAEVRTLRRQAATSQEAIRSLCKEFGNIHMLYLTAKEEGRDELRDYFKSDERRLDAIVKDLMEFHVKVVNDLKDFSEYYESDDGVVEVSDNVKKEVEKHIDEVKVFPEPAVVSEPELEVESPPAKDPFSKLVEEDEKRLVEEEMKNDDGFVRNSDETLLDESEENL